LELVPDENREAWDLRQDFQDNRGDVVMRRSAFGKVGEAVEQVIQGFGGGLELALRPEFGHARRREFDACRIALFVEAIGGEQDRVSRSQLNEMLFVSGGGKQAGRKSTFSEELAAGGGGMEREGKSSVRKG